MSEFIRVAGFIAPVAVSVAAVGVLCIQIHNLKERTGDNDSYLAIIRKRVARHI